MLQILSKEAEGQTNTFCEPAKRFKAMQMRKEEHVIAGINFQSITQLVQLLVRKAKSSTVQGNNGTNDLFCENPSQQKKIPTLISECGLFNHLVTLYNRFNAVLEFLQSTKWLPIATKIFRVDEMAPKIFRVNEMTANGFKHFQSRRNGCP